MSTIQLAAAIATPTGTGKLYNPYGSDLHRSIYQENGASGQPSVLAFARTPPKPTGQNRVNRGEMKITTYLADAEGVLHPCIVRAEYSFPVYVTTAQRTTLAEELGLLFALTPARSFLFQDLLPL